MNILVLGGSGLFGRNTVLHLLADKEISRVVSMDVTPTMETWSERNSLKPPG